MPSWRRSHAIGASNRNCMCPSFQVTEVLDSNVSGPPGLLAVSLVAETVLTETALSGCGAFFHAFTELRHSLAKDLMRSNNS